MLVADPFKHFQRRFRRALLGYPGIPFTPLGDSADITMGIGTSGYVRVRVRNVRVARAVLAIASGHPGAKVHLGVAVFVKIDPFCATRWCAAACRAVAATATSVMAAGRVE